jgi:uncharacterized protein (TIGR00255 family)
MNSMTGFGRGKASAEGWEFGVQVSSVNRKTLEVVVSLPREWQIFEPKISAAVREHAARGRVQVAIDVRGPRAAGLQWDEAAVESVLDRLAATAERGRIPFKPSPELLFQVANASRSDSVEIEPDAALNLILEAISGALAEFAAMRAQEGNALATDISARTATLAGFVENISKLSQGTVQNYREVLLNRLRQSGLELDLNDERVLKEIALFADRVDVSEEITRLKSHLEQMMQMVAATEPVGRKAEFLLQEIGREIHTIGSKANDLEIARAVIDFKNELERVREQIQNVE